VSWINTVNVEQAEGRLKKLYKLVMRPDGDVDNILKLHSLRPHSLEGHMALYKNVLHHYGNSIPTSFLEALGVLVSWLNSCEYCFIHHYEGMAKQVKDRDRAEQIKAAIEADQAEQAFEGKEKAAIVYARKLTVTPKDMVEGDVIALRDAGYDDGEILEINQVVAYFGYANRTILGLGGSTKGDLLGHSPNKSEDPNDWSHSSPD